MENSMAQQFIAALRELEDGKKVDDLAALYAADAAAGNLLAPDRFRGAEGAREFWTEYRGTFETVRSEFRNVIESENRAALEWTTDGVSFDAQPLRYCGVTILEFADGRLTRSCAYFDPTHLGRQVKNAGSS